jgi:Trk K+ transport system NAD-binding subunit
LYALAIVREFRWSLLLLVAMIVLGGLLYRLSSLAQFGGRPDPLTAAYGAWMAMLAQPIIEPPEPWHLTLMHAVYPVFGFILIGEGIVRLALLLTSRRQGEKEWMRVMASTCRDHIVLCGMGHLGYRVFQQLVASNVDVVVIELDANNRFLAAARATGACILVRDMKDDQALMDAGIERARAIIVATNDDMANLEVAIDARRLNKDIRILLRLWDQQIAQKIAGAMTIDVAFSASALAAPLVAALSLQTRVLSSTVIGGVPHVVCELRVEPGSPLAGKRIDQIEMGYATRILARTPTAGGIQSPPSPATTVSAGDTLVGHTSASQLATLAAAAAGAGSLQPVS